ncbi:MAG: oligosaccharide flippase family protein [Nanoarchaeota archaeon]|nr:oligosaccharide flippase family protein [Nanoarchaeota archaeon]
MKARINGYINSIMEESALIKDSGMLFLASFAGSLFLFVANIILSKQFGPEGFGNFKTVLSLFLFLPALIEFGAGATLTKYIAEGNTGIIRWFLKLRVISYAVVGGLIFAFRNHIAEVFLKNPALNYLVLPGLLVFFLTFFEVFKPIVQGFQNFKLLGWSQFLTMFLQGSLMIILGHYFGVAYAIIGWGIGYALANIPNIAYTFKKKISKTPIDIKKIFRNYSIPIHLMIIPNSISIAIIPILSLFFAQKLIGYYAFAWTFYSGVLLIPTALSSVMFPKISALHGAKDFKKAKSTLKKILLLYTPIALAGIAGTLMFSAQIINVVAPSYLPGLAVFEALVIFGIVAGYAQIYRTYLTAKGDMRALTAMILAQNVALLGVSFGAVRIV